MIGKLGAILSFIASLPAWILGLATAAFLSLFDLGKDLLCWCFDQLLSLVVYIINSIPVGNLSLDMSSYWAVIPDNIINILAYMYVPQAMTMVLTSLGIRFVLQLIPFVRLGS